jgi:hypothetical protein
MTAARIRLGIVRTATFALLLAVCANPASADIVYGVTGAGGSASSLYTVDPTTGAVTLVGAVGVSLNGIAYDSQNSTLYGIAGSSNSNLVTINTTTGAATVVGSLGNSIAAQGIAYNSATNTLYAYSKIPASTSFPEGLYTLNTTTGAASIVGSGSMLGFTSSGDGLAVDSSGRVYLAPGGASGGSGQPHANLYTINSTTGLASQGPSFSGAPLANSQMKAMSFDSSGNMYGLDFIPGGAFTTDLVSINPTTGAITNIGSTQNGLDGISFAPSAAVPEPSSFILVGLATVGFVLHLAYRTRSRPVDC